MEPAVIPSQLGEKQRNSLESILHLPVIDYNHLAGQLGVFELAEIRWRNAGQAESTTERMYVAGIIYAEGIPPKKCLELKLSEGEGLLVASSDVADKGRLPVLKENGTYRISNFEEFSYTAIERIAL